MRGRRGGGQRGGLWARDEDQGLGGGGEAGRDGGGRERGGGEVGGGTEARGVQEEAWAESSGGKRKRARVEWPPRGVALVLTPSPPNHHHHDLYVVCRSKLMLSLSQVAIGKSPGSPALRAGEWRSVTCHPSDHTSP